MSFVNACNKYFGRKHGQSLIEFAAELKDLTPQDRRELAQLLSVELRTVVELSQEDAVMPGRLIPAEA